jgi:oligopeptide transport system ATP-binding protein
MLSATDLRVVFRRRGRGGPFARGRELIAVDGVSLDIAKGEAVGLVGESGCGKSTLGRALLQLVRPASGSVRVDGVDLCTLDDAQLMPYRRRMQMVFQDPFSSLNPRLTVGQAVAEPLTVHRVVPPGEVPARVAEVFELVGLSPNTMNRYPHEFSGGQRQRVGIARALAARPDLLVCDEPVSSLDVSIQAQIVNLFEDLRASFGLAYLFVSHDLAVVRHLSDRIAVMYLGRVVELAPKRALFDAPLHPYTRLLMDAVPTTDRAQEKRRAPVIVQGEVPSPLAPPAGCRFHPRCPQASARCREQSPTLAARPGERWVACHLYD